MKERTISCLTKDFHRPRKQDNSTSSSRAKCLHTHVLAILVIMFWAALSACGAPEETAEITPAAQMERASKELMEADRAFARDVAERGLNGWMVHFAPGGSMVRGTGEVTGHSAIRASMEPLLSDTTVTFTWRPTRADVGAGGDLGYTVGRYEIRDAAPEGSAGALLGHGMYLSVWERPADGTWRVTVDIGSPAPLPEETARPPR